MLTSIVAVVNWPKHRCCWNTGKTTETRCSRSRSVQLEAVTIEVAWPDTGDEHYRYAVSPVLRAGAGLLVS